MKKLIRITTVPISLEKLLEGQLGFIKDYFEDIEPSDFHKLIPTFTWRALFTTNYDLLIEKKPKIPPKSTLGGAITYALNQWEKLMVHFQDGRLENNNNRTERGIKPFALGRRNWLFSCSAEGAAASARIYSFIETCKFHDIDAYYYFAYVLREIPQCTTLEELEALLPYNIDKKLLHPRNFIPEFPEP